MAGAESHSAKIGESGESENVVPAGPRGLPAPVGPVNTSAQTAS